MSDQKVRSVVCSEFGPFREVLTIANTARPEIDEDTVRVKVLSCGLAFPDILTLEGKHMMKPQCPFVPCNEVCGEVIEVGSGVRGFQVGDIVFGLTQRGALQSETLMQVDNVYRCPEGVDVHTAAGFTVNYGTTWHGLVDLAHLKKGETVLILGASGGVGMAAIDIAQAMGCNVVACASTPAKLEACRQAGANVLINYSGGAKKFKKALKDSGVYGCVDVVYDPVGGDLSEVCVRALSWAGRFVVIGFASGGATPKSAIPRLPLNLVLLNERQVLGCFWGAWCLQDGNKGNRDNINQMMELVRCGMMKPLVSKTYAFEDYKQAMEHMMNRKVLGKVTVAAQPQEEAAEPQAIRSRL